MTAEYMKRITSCTGQFVQVLILKIFVSGSSVQEVTLIVTSKNGPYLAQNTGEMFIHSPNSLIDP